MLHKPNPERYANPAIYRRCGRSGLKLPGISLGFWHNFGDAADPDAMRTLILRAFDLGITHFDLANAYGPPKGSAERNFGRVLHAELAAHRDELIISTKAGYKMWEGPYGDWGSRKYLISSLDQSLRRMGIDYVDIFYSHRPDPETPLEETMGALAQAVRAGKALYVGISNYEAAETRKAAQILRDLGTPCLISQPRYSMVDRTPEGGVFDALEQEGMGAIVFSPLGQGLLGGRYLKGIPGDSRVVRDPRFLKPEHITPERVEQMRRLDVIARGRSQTLAQMALAWVLRTPTVASALVGASRPEQLEENLGALANTAFSADELAEIDRILAQG
jgi:L-glyceraldehyde 3-phosphate reductase